MSRGLFITGTGTGVGKTYVGALIARALREAGKRVGVYKPVASGCKSRGGKLASSDAIALWEAAGRSGTLDQVCPQLFKASLAPHLAARAEGKRVDARLLREGINFWRQTSDVVLVEGAGGLMSPISDDDYNVDLAREFRYPLLIVSANQLGTINATLQTLITARACRGGVPVSGIVMNSPAPAASDPSVEANAEELAIRCDAPLLASVHYGGAFDRKLDWETIATLPH